MADVFKRNFIATETVVQKLNSKTDKTKQAAPFDAGTPDTIEDRENAEDGEHTLTLTR